MRRLFDFCYLLAYLLALPWIVYRYVAAAGWGSVRMRLGSELGEPLDGCIWLHASSVGETTLLKPLIQKLEQAYPNVPLVISTYTATGLDVARTSYSKHRAVAFPFDFKWIVRRYLERLQPRLVIIVESELWPSFINTLKDAGVPIAIVNGKMSAKSFGVHSRIGLVSRALRRIEMIAVQSEEHADRMRELGVRPERVFVTGNMKYDLSAPPSDASLRNSLRASLGYDAKDTVIIGASLHDREDQVVLSAFKDATEKHPEAALILVPRYPSEAALVAEHAREMGFAVVCKTDVDAGRGSPPGPSGILVVDTLGELARLYAAADVAFVGGSLFFRGANKGGHNLMEPAVLGLPVMFGPYNFSFREVALDLMRAGAGYEVGDARALSDALEGLLADPGSRRTMGERARRVVENRQGATENTFKLLEMLIKRDSDALAAQWH